MSTTKPKTSQALIELYDSLADEQKLSLSEFADFLLERYGAELKEVPPPADISRPETETVVGAVKRLKEKYHMVESMTVFSAASSLMTDHMVKGRDATEVIDELELLFEEAYTKLLDSVNDTGSGA